jgi:hypothetical protein
MPLARLAASLAGLSRGVSHDGRHPPFPSTNYRPHSLVEKNQPDTLIPTEKVPITPQATTPPTTKADSARQAELSLDFDGGWGLDLGSLHREDNPTKRGMSLFQTMWSRIDAAAVPQDPTVEGVREVLTSFNRS